MSESTTYTTPPIPAEPARRWNYRSCDGTQCRWIHDLLPNERCWNCKKLPVRPSDAPDTVPSSATVSSNPTMNCGHHISLLVRSVESDHQYCQLCEVQSRLRDAVEMELTYESRNAALTRPHPSSEPCRYPDSVAPPFRFEYTNHRGELSIRSVVPQRAWFGVTKWHLEPQWTMDALDTVSGEVRSFAMRDMRPLVSKPQTPDPAERTAATLRYYADLTERIDRAIANLGGPEPHSRWKIIRILQGNEGGGE